MVTSVPAHLSAQTLTDDAEGEALSQWARG